MAPINNHEFLDLNKDEDSGSDSDGGNSSGSGSRSSSPESGKNVEVASNKGSERSRSPTPNSKASGSPRSNASSPATTRRRDSGSRSDNPEEGSQKSRSPSANSGASGSRRSRSPVDDKSNASPKASDRSRSPSGERQEKHSSRSRSASHSEESNHSRQSSNRKSRSPSGNRSDSGSRKARSRSNTPHSNRSASKSPKSIHSGGSPVKEDGGVRSRSASPASGKEKSDNESGLQKSPKKRKRAVLSDDSGSDAEKNKKKSALSDSEEEKDEGEKNLVIDAEALFGDASDISSDEENKKGRAALKVTDDEDEEPTEAQRERDRDRDSDAGSEKEKSGDEGNDIEMNERDEDKENVPEEPIPETRIDVEIPKITTDLGKELHFVKLPNFLSVETRPFDPSTYEDEIDEEETLDEEGRARLKLKVENTIRWREVITPTETKKESNARFVRWSDGSMSLHLGSEIFDVYKQPLQGDHNHLFIRQGTGLQGQAVFRTKLTFRPHSTESFTHRKMTMSLADRSQKTSGIKVLSLVGKDPEAHRGELIKKEEERLRASVRRESKQKRVREKGASRGLSAGYLEPDRYGDIDSDDEGISINAIKKQHKNKLATQKGDRPNIYSSDEEGSDIETRRARRLDKAKALKDSDSDEGSGGGEEEGNASGGGSSSEE